MRRRKIRCDAVLRGLDDSQKKAVFEFAERHSLAKTAQWLKDEFDLANPETGEPLDHSTISRWLKAERDDAGMIELLGQIADDAERAEAVGEAIGKGSQLTEAATKMLAGAAFRFLRENPDAPDPEKLELFAKTILKIRGQDLDRDKLQAALRSKLETGLNALFEEIKGNPSAVAKYRELEETLKA